MNANRTNSRGGHSVTSAPVSPHQISALLSTFRELRDQGRTLMARLRASMYEMQVQRARRRHESEERTGGVEPCAPRQATVSALTHLQLDYGMTPRETEVALLLAEGCSNSTVARRLGISPHTARHHTQRVLGKLGVRSRSEAGARLRK